MNNQGDKRSDRTTFKVFLTKEQKAAHFAGLPAINKAAMKFHITSIYHRDLDRVAYTLRFKFNEKLRTKIVPDSLTLQVQFTTGGATEWAKASCESLSDKLGSIAIFREDEKKPQVLPTCMQVINCKDNFA